MTVTGAAAGAPALDHRRVLVVISGLLVGMFLAAIDQTIVTTALPTIVGDLGGIEQLSWVITAYLLTSTASTPLYGKLSDLYGRRRMFHIAIGVFLVGSALCGLSQELWQLVLFRGIQGLGGGGLISMAFTIVADILSPRDRGRYMGLFSAVFAVAGIGGPLLGGFFADHLSWRWIFYVNIPLGAIAFGVTSAVLRLPQVHRRQRLDMTGASLLVGWVTCTLLVSVWGGNTYDWGSPTILGMAGAAVVLFVLFVAQERRAPEPILPLRLFRNRTVAVCFSVAALTGGAMFGATVFLPLFLQAVTGVSATNSGLLLAPLMLAVTVSSITTGRRTSRTGRYKALAMTGVTIVIVGIAMLTTIGTSTSRYTIAAFMVTVGVGMGMHMPLMNLATQNAVDFDDLGTSTSAINFGRSLGGALGVAAFGSVMVTRLQDNLDQLGFAGDVGTLVNGPAQIRALAEPLRSGVIGALADSIAAVYLVAIPIVVVAAVIAWLLPELPLRTTVHMDISAQESVGAAAPAPPPT